MSRTDDGDRLVPGTFPQLGGGNERAPIKVAVLWQMALSGRWRVLFAAGATFTNATVPSMDHDFGALLAGKSSRGLNGLFLGGKVARDPFGTGLADRPFFPARNNMLAFAGHGPDSRSVARPIHHGSRLHATVLTWSDLSASFDALLDPEPCSIERTVMMIKVE